MFFPYSVFNARTRTQFTLIHAHTYNAFTYADVALFSFDFPQLSFPASRNGGCYWRFPYFFSSNFSTSAFHECWRINNIDSLLYIYIYIYPLKSHPPSLFFSFESYGSVLWEGVNHENCEPAVDHFPSRIGLGPNKERLIFGEDPLWEGVGEPNGVSIKLMVVLGKYSSSCVSVNVMECTRGKRVV